MSIFDTVHQIAQQLGVPDRLWESVVQIESGGDPTIVGDGGSSFGLFQLHRGGQAPSGVADSALLDPATNARYGLPAIQQAWQSLGPSFDDSLLWWNRFAGMSGHPGYDPTLTPYVAEELKAAYDANNFSFGSSASPLSSTSSSNSNKASSSSLNPLQGVNDFFGTIGGVYNNTNWGDVGIRTALVVGGVLLVIVALVLIFQPVQQQIQGQVQNSGAAKDALMAVGA